MCGSTRVREPGRRCASSAHRWLLDRAPCSCVSASARAPRAACASASRTMPGSRTARARSTSGSTGSSGSASTSSASTCTGTGSRRVRGKPDWGEQRPRPRGALRERGIAGRGRARRLARWANGGRTPNFAPGAASLRRVRAHRRDALSLGEPVADLERAEPGALASPDDARASTSASCSTRRTRRSTPSIPRAKVAGGVTAPRAGTGGVSPVAWIRGCGPPARASTRTRTTPIRSSTRETPFAGGCGHCETITMATLERLLAEVGRAFGAEADLADRVRLPDRRLRRLRSSARRELIGQAALRATRRRAWTC